MKKKLFLFGLCFLLFFACEKKKEPQVIRPKGEFNVRKPEQSDREPNGGKLRFTLNGKTMHDDFFVAQFTPRGDVFDKDNLQLYNYNFGSDKYPQFIINIDYRESDLKKWEGKKFPLDFLAFTAAPNTVPFNSKGELRIIKVTDTEIQGTFHGELIHPVKKTTYEIKGDFKAIIRVNI